ncbi:DUF1702 family protein [Streptosporangium subroseum]|uniref:DUF1702 family protein n=1 Tax=Streptosporangium subroseum TaxID=106412 RepID=UPI00117E0BF2|nr:DUF1702 family protein [Streptosporangium subroseum]
MSNAEGTRVIAQSDETERATAHRVPEPARADADRSGAESTPVTNAEKTLDRTQDVSRDSFWDIPAEKTLAGHDTHHAGTSSHGAEAGTEDDTSETGTETPGTEDDSAEAILNAIQEPDTSDASDPAELVLTRPGGLVNLLWKNPGQADFGPRRFRLGPARERLETSGRAFLTGFNAMLAREVDRIDDLPEELRGFAYEGAGMACANLDILTITGGRRLRDLLNGQGMRYPHLIHMGTGWAYARLHMRPMWGIRSVHPLLRWLAFDGFGFHQGFFLTDRTVGRQRTAGLMDRTQRAIFDQGLGRMLWFHECAGVDDVVLRIAEFPAGRRADLWSGVGLAATYVGGASAADLEWMALAATEDGFRAHLAQGSAFGCASRLISGIVPEHTVAAAPALCGVEVDEAGGWTDTALIALGHNAHSGDHYQAWRAGIRKAWARRNRDS